MAGCLAARSCLEALPADPVFTPCPPLFPAPQRPARSVLRLWVPLLATVLAVKAGEGVTGPSLNPAFTFSWLFLFPHSQSAAEHCLVYWVAPLAAGLFGGWAFEGWQQWDAQRQRRHAHAKAD